MIFRVGNEIEMEDDWIKVFWKTYGHWNVGLRLGRAMLSELSNPYEQVS